MGCIKPSGEIKINKIEKVNKNEYEQNKLIVSYISSSQCSDSDESSKNSPKKKENISQNKNLEKEKEQKNEDERS